MSNSNQIRSHRASANPEPRQYELLDVPESRRELQPLEWRVRVHRRARNLSLHVEPNGSVRVTVPPRTRPSDVAAFVQENAAWIDKAQRFFEQRISDQTLLPETIPLPAIGIEMPVCYRETQHGARPRLFEHGDRLEISSPDLRCDLCWPLLRDWLKRTAKDHLVPKINALGKEINLKPKRVQVRLQKSRWGSCSSTGTVSLNAALLLRTPAQVRYLLVHELSHLQHMNHSARFWALVASHEPGYKALDQALNEAWRETPLWLLR